MCNFIEIKPPQGSIDGVTKFDLQISTKSMKDTPLIIIIIKQQQKQRWKQSIFLMAALDLDKPQTTTSNVTFSPEHVDTLIQRICFLLSQI